MSSARKLFTFCVLAIVGLVSAGYWFTVARFQESTDNAYLQSDIVYVSTKQPGYADAGWIKDNQKVHEGDVLARIEATDYKLKVDEAKAEVHSAKAAIQQFQSQRSLQQSQIHVAEAQLNVARAEQELAASELKRIAPLFERSVISRDKLDNAQAANKKAIAQVQGQKAALESTRRQLSVIDNQIVAAQASLQQAQSVLAIARQSLAETVITAPIDGVIGQRQVKDGQLLKSGSVLFSLVNTDTVWVTANFKETQISRMQTGQPVELEIDAFPGQPITGYIDSLWPASGARFSLLPPENATGNFTKIVQRIPVKIVIPADQALAGQLRAGMSVTANVDTREEPVNLKALTFTHNNQSTTPAAQIAGL
ncbi:HlyD family secretion protein [Sansalvadorimonas verongulae]|uniref:HlyD family secretion protein n=1 Tax=Sansalvadorimonas verongulae TaxID=2172824 RepID=UPI0012BC0434|nr:HlyD family secretion protein [Sansalvadorimonas verongulae]MTI13578.1 HlyD family secretion protein [Sansalvadorimonas verongulae]